MSNDLFNLAFRLFLELFAFFALGFWGWTQHSGPERFLWGFGLPVLAAVVWAVFRVPGEPGKAPVPVPGPVRLAIEALFFGGAVWALYAGGRGDRALTLGVLVLLHYGFSYDRIIRLVKNKN